MGNAAAYAAQQHASLRRRGLAAFFIVVTIFWNVAAAAFTEATTSTEATSKFAASVCFFKTTFSSWRSFTNVLINDLDGYANCTGSVIICAP